MTNPRNAQSRPRSRKGQGEGRDLLSVARRCSVCEQISSALTKRQARAHGLLWLCRCCEIECERWLLP